MHRIFIIYQSSTVIRFVICHHRSSTFIMAHHVSSYITIHHKLPSYIITIITIIVIIYHHHHHDQNIHLHHPLKNSLHSSSYPHIITNHPPSSSTYIITSSYSMSYIIIYMSYTIKHISSSPNNIRHHRHQSAYLDPVHRQPFHFQQCRQWH